MFCTKCGEQIPDDGKFCPKCGTPVVEDEIPVTPPSGKGNEPSDVGHPPKKKKKKWPWIVLIILILFIIAVVAIVVVKKQSDKKEYEGKLVKAEKSMKELDYSKAKKEYLDAIKLKPEKSKPYLGLADLYIIQDKPEEAQKVLEKAVKYVDKSEIKVVETRYQIYTYPEKKLKKEEGSCDASDDLTCEYKKNTAGVIWVESLHDLKGVLNWYIADYDNDGEEELLVLTLDNAKEFSQDYDNSIVRNEVDLQMYEMEDGELKLQATYEGLIPVLGYGDKEDDGIFLKKSDDTIYICGSCINDVYMYANGTMIKSFVLTYTDGAFQVQAGQETPIAGSEWSGEADVANQMADLLEQIGLPKDADWIRSDNMPVFRFMDQADHTLLRIHGENEGGDPYAYFDTGDVSALGKVKLEIKYGDMQPQYISDGTLEDDSSTAQTPSQNSAPDYYTLYGGLLDEVNAAYGEYNYYYIYDIDNDGVKELLLQEGTCEADYQYYIYTIENGAAVYLDTIPGGHTMFYEDAKGGSGNSILQLQAHMGYEMISRITLNNGKVSTELLSERELGESDEYFDNGFPLPGSSVTDKSYLN